MTLKQIIATNLRRLCDLHEMSYAQIARNLQITPQHLNNFLTAKNVPSEDLAGRICTFFKIEEEQLYLSNQLREKLDTAVTDPITRQFADQLGHWRARGRADLKEGIYACYFMAPRDTQNILCSSMFLKEVEGIMTFRRITSLNRSAQSGAAVNRSEHKGIVFQHSRSRFCFSAVNARPTYEPSMFVVEWAATAEPILTGHATVEATHGPAVIYVAVQPQFELTLKQALKSTRFFHRDENKISASVLRELDHVGRKF